MQQDELTTIKALTSGPNNLLANITALQEVLDNRKYALDHAAAAYKRTLAAKRLAPKVRLHAIEPLHSCTETRRANIFLGRRRRP